MLEQLLLLGGTLTVCVYLFGVSYLDLTFAV